MYHELPPPADLAAYLRCLWTETTSDRAEQPLVSVLPDGCIDVVWVAGRSPVAVGPATRAQRPKIPPGSALVGARFAPGMAGAILGAPAHELLDADVPLIDLWGHGRVRTSGRFDGTGALEDGVAEVEALLRDRLEQQAGSGDELVCAAAAWLARRTDGHLDGLAELTGLGERQLRRRFEAAIGYGPKTFQRIMRFRRWLELAESAPPTARKLADLAAEAGYADQAHLTREVTRLAGEPPSALLRI